MTCFSHQQRIRFYPLFCLLVLLKAPGLLLAEDAPTQGKPPRLFQSEDVLAITLTAPWNEIERNRKYQGAYPATIEYTGPDGAKLTHKLTVERRGLKRQEACRIPPIRLRFEKEEVKGSLFRGQKSLKMVTHCENSTRFDQYYLLEMAAYRIYNRVTDYSFRVRPLSVTYRDSKKGDSDADRFAFLIEDDSDVAERHGLKNLDIGRTLPSRLDKATSSDMALFQMMIGNLDYSPLRGPDPQECCHNVKLIAPRPLEQGDTIWPIPYDFDASGIVDAPYAVPPAGLGVRSITQRLYRGYCAHNGTLQESRRKIIGLEPEIMAVLDGDPRLSSRSKKKAGRFLEKYFELIRDDRDFERQVVMKCRK